MITLKERIIQLLEEAKQTRKDREECIRLQEAEIERYERFISSCQQIKEELLEDMRADKGSVQALETILKELT